MPRRATTSAAGRKEGLAPTTQTHTNSAALRQRIRLRGEVRRMLAARSLASLLSRLPSVRHLSVLMVRPPTVAQYINSSSSSSSGSSSSGSSSSGSGSGRLLLHQQGKTVDTAASRCLQCLTIHRFMNRNARRPKRANHGKRPVSHARRREKAKSLKSRAYREKIFGFW